VRLGLVLTAVALLAAAPAHASSTQESLFQDDDLLVHQAPAEVDAAMAELAGLGVDRVRLPALWADLAPAERLARPADPAAYPPQRLAPLDHAIASAHAHGLAVLLNPRGGVPPWARGKHPPAKLRLRDAFKPRPRAFGAFVRMLGTRYSGTYEGLPRVDAWSIWNEPNWHGLLQPQSRHGVPVAPAIYRRLYRAATAALAATGHGDDTTLIGETAPLGTEALGRLKPLLAALFYRQLFCLNDRLKPLRGRAARQADCGSFARGPLHATGVAHHPYPVLAPPEFHSIGPDEIRLADSRRLKRILNAARRYGRIDRPLPIWHTEFGYQTNPPDPIRGVSLRRQAAWNVRAEYLAYRDPRVVGFTQFLLVDSEPQRQYPVSDSRYWATYQTGLRFADGRPKPAYAAYRLPFLRLSRTRFWGQVRPAATDAQPEIVIEHRRRAGRPWRAVSTRRVTNPRGFFVARLARAGAGQYRFSFDGLASRPAVAR
jgi:hypothetical protein